MELDMTPTNDASPPDRQFVAVRFKPEAKRLYTYHNDGPPLSVGDRPAVAAFQGDGWQRVEVVEIVDQLPTFATKPILVEHGVEPLPAAG